MTNSSQKVNGKKCIVSIDMIVDDIESLNAVLHWHCLDWKLRNIVPQIVAYTFLSIFITVSRLTMKYWNHFQNKLSKHSKIIRFRFDLKIGELTKKCFVAYCFGFHHLGPYFRPLNAFQLYRRCFYDFLWIGFNYCAAARLQHSFLTFLNTKNHSH